jgi:hypothetical protein
VCCKGYGSSARGICVATARTGAPVLEIQQRYKIGVWRYLRNSRITVVITAPLVYSGWIAFAALDTFVSLFQAVYFPIYGIAIILFSLSTVMVKPIVKGWNVFVSNMQVPTKSLSVNMNTFTFI